MSTSTNLHEQVNRHLTQQQYAEAIALIGEPTTADDFGLLGLAHFHNQAYSQAEDALRQAVALDPNGGWIELLERATDSAQAELSTFVPPKYYFDRDQLLREAPTPDYLPTSVHHVRQPTFLEQAYRFVGNRLGSLISVTMAVLTWLWGNVFGFRGRVWTNWDERPLTLGMLTLAYMRNQLNRHNLKDVYADDELTGYHPTPGEPPPGVKTYRTADGTWNNLSNPKEGAAGTRFMRNVEPDSVHPEPETLLDPDPREISRRLLTRNEGVKEVPFLNLLAASWIQFQNHGWITHGEVLFDDTIELPLAEDDPLRKKYRQSALHVPRSQPDPTARESQPYPISYINEVTHWWDGSQIYGSDIQTQMRLRSQSQGKLKLQDDGRLPLTDDQVEDTGFVRNWWVGLAMFHNLFAREHNAICDRLRLKYPHWEDNRLFNVARLINAAVIAKVHSVEWTPAILPNPALNLALNANWYGIATTLFRSGKHRQALANIRIRNPEMGGVVGNPIDKHGAPFGLTEEFVEVYRLHSLLPENLTLRTIAGREPFEEVPLVRTRQRGSSKLTDRVAMDDLFCSFGVQHPGQLVLNNFPGFMQEMAIPGMPVLDLAVVDIIRARERGVPRYNEFRRQLGLKPIGSIADLTDNEQHATALRDIYGDGPEGVERIDLMVGTLAETDRPKNFGFGETLFQIFILNATRRLQADRFYTDSYNEETYTFEGLQWIDDSNLKTVLLRHYPQLGETGLANIRNAFEPWDEGRRLDPERHPLRACDPDLKDDNPWLGEVFR